MKAPPGWNMGRTALAVAIIVTTAFQQIPGKSQMGEFFRKCVTVMQVAKANAALLCFHSDSLRFQLSIRTGALQLTKLLLALMQGPEHKLLIHLPLQQGSLLVLQSGAQHQVCPARYFRTAETICQLFRFSMTLCCLCCTHAAGSGLLCLQLCPQMPLTTTKCLHLAGCIVSV